MHKGPVKLITIADELGLSIATVSMALRDSPKLRPETKLRVQEAANRLGYVPNLGAASLRTKKRDMIAIAVHDILNPYFAKIFRAIETTLEARGYSVIISNHHDDLDRQQRFLVAMQQQRADGFVICPSAGSQNMLMKSIHDAGVPVTLVCRKLSDAVSPIVRGDDVAGMLEVGQHLAALGHRQVAMVGGKSYSSSGEDRLNGLMLGLEQFGVPFNMTLHYPDRMTEKDGWDVVPRILGLKQRPTAIACFNDQVALGLMGGLNHYGMQAGRDIAVTGYDNIASSAFTSPPLTTVDSDPSAIGRMAADTLLKQIEGQTIGHKEILIPPHLVVRNSSSGGLSAPPSSES
jgi:DNA-binding LacI/PurR family transcriptional regulator